MRPRAVLFGTAAALLALLLIIALSDGSRSARRAEHADDEGVSSAGDGLGAEGSRPAAGSLGALRLLDGGMALVPGEDTVPVESDLVVAAIETDRPWVCAGESMGLAARLRGELPPDLVQRWVWASPEGGAELHPGSALAWRAPPTPGTYTLHFQACRDLGGRRVGVLAEGVAEVHVRACGEGAEARRLRLEVAQRHRGAYAFHVEPPEGVTLGELRWDLGDGTRETSTGADLTHAYALDELSPHESRAFVVRVESDAVGGEPLTASAVIMVRGPAPRGEPPPARARVERWQRRPDGRGWQSEIAIQTEGEEAITWELLERITKYFDDRVDVRELALEEAVVIDEAFEGGGFRGRVSVDDAEVPPEVKQIIDQLHGHDEHGQPVSLSWTPFERQAPPGESEPPSPSPRAR